MGQRRQESLESLFGLDKTIGVSSLREIQLVDFELYWPFNCS